MPGSGAILAWIQLCQYRDSTESFDLPFRLRAERPFAGADAVLREVEPALMALDPDTPLADSVGTGADRG
jgi:hypothetical protein